MLAVQETAGGYAASEAGAGEDNQYQPTKVSKCGSLISEESVMCGSRNCKAEYIAAQEY
jgi:hypothetical protein